jgi:hypothetical protein
METQEVTCSVRCNSAETLRQAMELARTCIHPDNEIVKTFRTFPAGVERREVRAFRLGDYFDGIQLIREESDGPLSFRLIFRVSQSVRDNYWKDLLVAVLRSVSDGLPGVSTSIMRETSTG